MIQRMIFSAPGGEGLLIRSFYARRATPPLPPPTGRASESAKARGAFGPPRPTATRLSPFASSARERPAQRPPERPRYQGGGEPGPFPGAIGRRCIEAGWSNLEPLRLPAAVDGIHAIASVGRAVDDRPMAFRRGDSRWRPWPGQGRRTRLFQAISPVFQRTRRSASAGHPGTDPVLPGIVPCSMLPIPKTGPTHG